MPFPFGVSVGDFISALNLVRTVLAALSDTHGAGAQYRAVIAIFDGIGEALKSLETIECDLEALSAALHQATLRLEASTELFLRKIEKYQPALLNLGGSSSKIKDAVRKIQWALFNKDDIMEFQAEMLGHATSIQMFLHRVTLYAHSPASYRDRTLLMVVVLRRPRSAGISQKLGVRWLERRRSWKKHDRCSSC